MNGTMKTYSCLYHHNVFAIWPFVGAEVLCGLLSRSRGPNFTLRDRGVNACLAQCLNSVLNVKAVVAAFNQEKALVILRDSP